MNRFARVASLIFGVLMLALSVLVTLEAILRKAMQFSFGGVDELSGYAIAICAPLAFAVALIDQAHIRINLLYVKLSLRTQAILDGVSALSLLLLALFLGYFTVTTVQETQNYASLAQTPWATPLIYPQSLWALAMAFFAVVAVLLGLRALRLMLSKRWDVLHKNFGPDSVEDELKSELADLQRR